MLYVSNKGADQPAHLRSQINIFAVRSLDSIISINATIKISRLYLASKAEQAMTWLNCPINMNLQKIQMDRRNEKDCFKIVKL